MDKRVGCLLGGIVGDAFGSPYQFRPRGSYDITPDMEPCTCFEVPAGAFTDDGAMMLCLARSLTVRGGFDEVDQMRRYHRWLEEGYMSSVDEAFDIGGTTTVAVTEWAATRPAVGPFGLTDEDSKGNGGIMRLGPILVFYHERHDECVEYARRSSAVTHATVECMDCAALMAHVLFKLLNGATRAEALDNADFEVSTPVVRALCAGEYKAKTRDQISTSGYVAHTLKAALWALHRAESYEDGVMTLARMGSDVDMVCCVFGQLAGALWGAGAVPERWVDALLKKDMVVAVVQGLVKASA